MPQETCQMTNSHKRQHWVPRSYLKAWVNPQTPHQVHIFDKAGGNSRKRAPKSIFTETDLYTIQAPNDSRDLKLEHGLAEVESLFSRLRKDFLQQRRPLPSLQYGYLLIFIASLHVRTPVMRDHHGKFWKEVLDSCEELETRMKTATIEEIKRAISPRRSGSDNKNSMSMDQVRQIAENTMQEMLVPFIAAEARCLAFLKASVLCTDSEPGFITSDKPVNWFNPEAYKNHPFWRSPSFSDPKLEITMPISPNQLILLTHGEYGLNYFDVSDKCVLEANTCQRFNCDKNFVVNKDFLDPRWFDRGEKPEDSWEKRNEKNK